jgi:hypothetical protein
VCAVTNRVVAAEVSSTDSWDLLKEGVSTGAWALRLNFEHVTCTSDCSDEKSVTDLLLVHVLVRANSLLGVRDVQDALGTIRTLFVCADSDEKDRDKTKKNCDNECDLDKSKTGLLFEAIEFHYIILFVVVVVLFSRGARS